MTALKCKSLAEGEKRMIIDFHNHIWPDKIAGTIASFFRQEDIGYDPVAPCTLSGLLRNMEETGTGKCVVLDVALKANQVEAINNWLLQIKDERIVPFGAMHPDYPDYKKEIQRLKDHGIQGVKFQSTWQGCFVDDDRMLRIYEAIGEEMIVFFHAGGSRTKRTPDIEAPPHRIARVMDLFPGLRIVAAHLGGNYMLEESKKYLVGQNLVLETSHPPSLESRVPQEKVVEMIKAHGAGKIVFGTDFPLSNRKREAEYILQLPLSPEEKERILWKNAADLLKLD